MKEVAQGADHDQRPWLLGLLALGTVAGAATLLPDAVRAATPIILLDPDMGPSGTPVEITGADFTPGAALIVEFRQGALIEVQGTALPAADGTFVIQRIVPASAVPGPAQFVVSGLLDPLQFASANFLVTNGDDGGDPMEPPDDGDGGEVDDPPGNRRDFCRIVITLKTVLAESLTLDPGSAVGLRIDTFPASRGAPGAGFDLAVLVGEETQVNRVVREYLVPKRAFPARVMVGAKVEVTSSSEGPFKGKSVKSTRQLVNCPSSQELSVGVRFGKRAIPFLGLPFEPTNTFKLTYGVEVTEVETQ